MGRGFSEILAGELVGTVPGHVIDWRGLHSFDPVLGPRPVAAPGISAERSQATAAGANQIVYGEFSVVNGSLRATAMVENPETRKMDRVISATAPAAGGIFTVADALARQLGTAHAFGTRNPQALREYVAGLEAPDPASAFASFARAAAADPAFGSAYVIWLDTAAVQRNRAEAVHALEQARTHMDRFSELDRTRLNLGAAALNGDFQGRLQALKTLTRLAPQDPDNNRALAETLMSTRDFSGAVAEFRRALAIRPDDILSLNAMGYAAAYSGDLPTAIRVLRGYEQLRPREPNPLDSLGDVHFMLGHYAEAEQFYLAAQAKAPTFLNSGESLKAAQARLMTGDVPGAAALFNRYLSGRRAAKDPFADYHAASWSWQTGARRAAIRQMDDLARTGPSGPLPELASRAAAQSALWLLELGDRPGAAGRARMAVAAAVPATAGIAAVMSLLAEPGAYPALPDSPVADYARAYSLLFAKQFQPAAEILQKIYQRPTNDPDDGLAVLLAWALEETGQWQRAEPLLRLNPLPQATGLPIFSSLYFPRLFFLRGAVLERSGRRQDASSNYRLFLALSGPDAGLWGEEQRARQAISH